MGLIKKSINLSLCVCACACVCVCLFVLVVHTAQHVGLFTSPKLGSSPKGADRISTRHLKNKYFEQSVRVDSYDAMSRHRRTPMTEASKKLKTKQRIGRNIRKFK